MKKRLYYLIPLFLFLCYYGFSYYIKHSGPEKGEMAPDFEVELIDGSSFQLSELRGEYVLIEFWGSWCAPCIQSIPNLSKLQENHPDLNIVTIALEKSGDNWKKAADKFGFDWKYQIVEKHKIVMLSDLARMYGVAEIPAKFLISPEGVILPKMNFDEIDKMLSEID